MEGKEKDKKDEKKKKVSKISSKKDEEINLDNKFFFISCFNKDLHTEKEITFYLKENEGGKIDYEYSYESDIFPQYIPKVYCIYFKMGQKKPKVLNLSFSLDSLVFWELNEISIKEKKRFIFIDIKIVEKNLYKFIHYVNNELGIKNIERNNYCLNLDFDQKLNIYKKIFEKIHQNPEKRVEYNENFSYDSVSILNKNNIKKLNFSSAINLFCLSYENKNIIYFLDISSKIIYIKDNFQNDIFNKLINNYLNNKKEFFNTLQKIKNNEKYEHYKKLMNNFMLIYFLFYEKEKIMENKKARENSKKILLKIINERDDITDTVKIINEYLELLLLIYKENQDEEKDNKRIMIKNKNIINIKINDFKDYYNKIVEYEKNKNIYFLDFSYVIENFIKAYSSNLLHLKNLFLSFKYELKQYDNYRLRDKLNNIIDNLGKKLIKNENIKNEYILDFITYNEIYLSKRKNNNSKDKFINIYNDVYKKRKKIDILRGIDINSKEDPIISEIEKYQTYKYFYSDMCSDYIKVFTNKISHIKNLGIFFNILPKV